MAYVRECVDQDETIKWIGPDVVEVRQKGHLITTEQMRTIVDSYIEKHVPSDGSSQVRFEVRSMPQAFTVPHGKIVYKVVPSSPNILEARQFSIIFRHKGQVLKNVRLRGQIHALQQVAVAYCQLERDQLVQADDIHMVSKDITSCDHPFLKKEDVVGKKIRRTLYPGQVIEARWVERPDLIERGQLITMYIQKGSLLISAQGIACSDGKKDQIIKIKNISSEKNVYCKIISADKAIVEY
jgi:flagella basal body P-ring formation protein FlgA